MSREQVIPAPKLKLVDDLARSDQIQRRNLKAHQEQQGLAKLVTVAGEQGFDIFEGLRRRKAAEDVPEVVVTSRPLSFAVITSG